jgi:TonB family protein
LTSPSSQLRAYELYAPTNTSLVERVWDGMLVVVVFLALLLGNYLHNVKQPPEILSQKVDAIRTRLVIEQKKKVQPAAVKKEAEKPKPVEKPAETKPIDLTSKPVLNQKQDDIVANPPPGATVVRRVYGLRKVYSVGLGAQGGNADAVIGKLGNTLNTDIDTVKATPQDLKGALVSITSVTTSPSTKRKVLPEISQVVRDNRVSGTIKVRVLVDAEGNVREAEPLNDLGFGTAEAARKAAMQWTFQPAMQGDKPVSVYITIIIRFELIEG